MSNKVRYAVGTLALSALGLTSIANFEGFREEAYIPVKGDVPTIGYGTTKNVKLGDRITKEEALVRLREDATEAEDVVKKHVKVPLTQAEYDAYVSFIYNVGGRNFARSTLLQKLNQEDYEGACLELKRWVYANGIKYKGLENRRFKELQRCLGNDVSN